MPKRTLTKTKTKTRVLGMVIVGVGVIGLGVMAALVIANTQTASMPCKTDIDCANFPCEEYGPYGERQTGRCEPYQDVCSCQKWCENDSDCNLVCPTGSNYCDGRLCSCEDSGLEPAPPPDQSGQYISCAKDSDCTNKLVSCDKTKFNEVCGANNLCQCFAKSAPAPAPAPTPTPPAPAPTLSCAKDSDCTNKIASCDKTKFNEVCGANKICQCVVKPTPTPTPPASNNLSCTRDSDCTNKIASCDKTKFFYELCVDKVCQCSKFDCTDSDSGYDFSEPGCVRYNRGGEMIISCDSCKTGGYITEAVCFPAFNFASTEKCRDCETTKISAFGKIYTSAYCQ